MLISLTHLGVLKVSGADAASFLQGQLSSDIRTLEPLQQQLGAFCNRQGRVLALMDILRIAQDYFLIIPKEIIHNIQSQLQKYIVFSQAKIDDVSDFYTGLAIIREKPELEINEGILFQHTPAAPWQLWAHKDAAQTYFSELNQTQSIGQIKDYLLAQIHAHIPFIGAAQTALFLPHPLDLVSLGAVNFKKGCYVGQEIIARMQYRGHNTKHLHHDIIHSPTLPAPKTEVTLPQNTTATVVNAQALGEQQYAVLVIL